MWTDNDTDRDFVNFTGVADTVAEIIVHAAGEPVSIGVSGAWGVGKSSMIRLIRRSLKVPDEGAKPQFLFVDFNAWLYQGFDEARSALMDVIAGVLADAAKDNATALDKAKSLLKRLNWFRIARLTAGSAAALAFGLPPIGVIGDVVALVKEGREKGVDGNTIAKADELLGKLGEEAPGLLKSSVESTAPREIQAIRDDFSAALEALDITLVVLIDDLDRCLPETTISTLEAIRLFLFLPRTAFVIAADDEMIKHAVRKHFDGVSDTLVTNYFDKLVQVPIRVPALGTQEVRAYLIMLFVENSALPKDRKDSLREAVCTQLAKSWQGARVDRKFVQGVEKNLPPELLTQIDVAERLAPIMTGSKQIRGNPRLIKRFLNALAVRKSIAKRHGVALDEGALVKMLLFERCGNASAYQQIAEAVNRAPDGKAAFLGEWEREVAAGKKPALPSAWDDEFSLEWLALPPNNLGSLDLRGVLYVSREHLQLVSPQDRLSSDAASVLEALLAKPALADKISGDIRKLARADLSLIMDRLLQAASQEDSWGVPDILHACIALAETDADQAKRLVAFLRERPPAQVDASIVPVLAERSWASDVCMEWSKSSSISGPVKRAIAGQQKKG